MATQISLPILDVSRYDANAGNGTYVGINWQLARAKWLGSIIKAGEANFVDPAYDEHVASSKVGDAPWGSYYLYRTSYNAIAAAHLFCDQVERYGGYGQLGVWLDAEYNNAPLHGSAYLANMGSWLYEVKKRMTAFGANVPIGIYTRNSFIDPLWVEAGRPNWLREYLYWQGWYKYNGDGFAAMYARIVNENYLPPIPRASLALGECVLHQWTDKGRPSAVPGYPPYKMSIDFNVVYQKFWQDSAPVPPPTPEPEPIPDQYLATATAGLNMRFTPETTGRVIGSIPSGTMVLVQDDTDDDYAEIQGFVSKQYLRRV